MAVMVTSMKTKSYEELSKIDDFEKRYEYLKLNGKVAEETFGHARYLNQDFYKNDPDWLQVRDEVIIRDDGCDLGIKGRTIGGCIFVHHINPITKEQIIARDRSLYDPNNLICCSKRTHDAIHYSSSDLLIKDPIARTKNDTCPWKH